MEQASTSRLYDIRALGKLLSMGRTTIQRKLENDEHFPKPKRICGKNYWTSGQIDRYIQFIENDGYADSGS